jgi:hypothetical protein
LPSRLFWGPPEKSPHSRRRGLHRRKKLSGDCQKTANFTFGNRTKLVTIRLDIARAETKTNHSRRSPAPASANRPLAQATADCCRGLMTRSEAPDPSPHTQCSSPKRRPAKAVRSPTRRVITCTSRRRLGASARISPGYSQRDFTAKFHGALRHGPPRKDFPPPHFSFEGQFFRTRKHPIGKGPLAVRP